MNSEKEYIEKIEEHIGYKHGECDGFDGFIVTTNKQEIKLFIDNQQYCCESWGYLFCNELYEEFIGKELYEISIVDICLVKKEMPFDHLDEGDVVFVNFETEAGTLQFAAYNSHNGYYGHTVWIETKKFTKETSI